MYRVLLQPSSFMFLVAFDCGYWPAVSHTQPHFRHKAYVGQYPAPVPSLPAAPSSPW